MRLRTVLLAASLAVNAVFAALVTAAFLVRPGRSVFYETPPEGEYLTGAAVASVPAGADLSFGPVSISLESGEEALVQYSYVGGGRQVNWYVTALYDRAVVEVEVTRFGMRIKALGSGETVLQTISAEGVRDVVKVRVTRPEWGAVDE